MGNRDYHLLQAKEGNAVMAYEVKGNNPMEVLYRLQHLNFEKMKYEKCEYNSNVCYFPFTVFHFFDGFIDQPQAFEH